MAFNWGLDSVDITVRRPGRFIGTVLVVNLLGLACVVLVTVLFTIDELTTVLAGRDGVLYGVGGVAVVLALLCGGVLVNVLFSSYRLHSRRHVPPGHPAYFAPAVWCTVFCVVFGLGVVLAGVGLVAVLGT